MMQLASDGASCVACCKICGGAAPVLGAVDFNKACEAGGSLPRHGRDVTYRRCEACGFLFTRDMDDWPLERFAAEIYNADYARVDPDYLAARPERLAGMMLDGLVGKPRAIRLLDYGGGEGLLAARLRAAGWNALSWDPFVEGGAPPAGPFHLVTCFEVMEHAPDPQAIAADIARLLAPGGQVIFSTLTQPEPFAPHGLDWWYCAPRNGHVSLFTRDALARLWAGQGMGYRWLSEQFHLAEKPLSA